MFPTEKIYSTYALLLTNKELIYESSTRLPWWLSGKESTCQCRRCAFDPWDGKIPWRRKWQPTPVVLPGESHGQRSLVSYSPWGGKDSDRAEHTFLVL